jgi:hypothetical protein
MKSPSRKQLDLIEFEINRRLTGGDASYTASNTTITKINFQDLCDERNRLIEVVNTQSMIIKKNRGVRPRKIVWTGKHNNVYS